MKKITLTAVFLLFLINPQNLFAGIPKTFKEYPSEWIAGTAVALLIIGVGGYFLVYSIRKKKKNKKPDGYIRSANA